MRKNTFDVFVCVFLYFNQQIFFLTLFLYFILITGLNQVSLIVPVRGEKNKYLISIGRELAVVTWDGESEKVAKIEKIVEIENDPETIDNRFNDGKCDPSGRLWAGK